MRLLKVFVSELCPLQFQSSVDHPHGSGQNHIHCPYGRYHIVSYLYSFLKASWEVYFHI